MKKIKNLFLFVFTKEQRIRFATLALGMMSNGFLEMFSVAAVIPFLSVAANPDLIGQNQHLYMLYNLLGFNNNRQFIIFLGVVLMCIILLVNVSNAFFTWFSLRFSWAVNNSLSIRLLKHYLHQDYLSFLQRNSSDLQKNIQTEVGQFVANFIRPILNLLNKSFSVLLNVILLTIIDPIVTLLMGLTFGIIYFIIYNVAKRSLTQIGKRSLKDNENKFKAVNEALGGFKIAKLSGLESFFIERFAKASQRFTQNQCKRMVIGQMPRYAVEAIAFSVIIVITLNIIATKSNFTEVVPILGVYVFAAYRLMPGLQQFYINFSIIRSFWPNANYIQNELKSEFASHKTRIDSRELNQIIGANSESLIEFVNISFSYPNSMTTTINKISFTMAKNISLGIMGETGSGKSTIVDMILGIIFPDTGTILINGIPVNRKNVTDWQKSIGYVPQDIYLTDDTIAENIAFGLHRKEINMGRVRKAASLANISEFIENELIEKYETVVGERGIRLSGGQCQRIGIARALYSDPQLIVFDEATSALDNETEKSVMEAIQNISNNKSIIIIAHRITTLQECDWVIKVDKGEIVRSGTFSEVTQMDIIE